MNTVTQMVDPLPNFPPNACIDEYKHTFNGSQADLAIKTAKQVLLEVAPLNPKL